MGQRIVRLRTQAGLSQDALAERLGVSRQSVSKWETDGSIPDLDRLVRLSEIFGVTLDELVKGAANTGADALSGSEPGSQIGPSHDPKPSPSGAGTAGPSNPSPAGKADTETVLRLHRQKLAGILLMVVSLAVTLLNVALFFVTLPVFASGVLCVLVRRRLGLAIGWTLWIFALLITRSATSISMNRLTSPAYWQNTALLAPLLALLQLVLLGLLIWRTLRNPPGLKACWAIWLGLLAALWLSPLYLLSIPQLQSLSAGMLLANFFPLLSAEFYRSAPLGAVLWWCYVLAAVWLVRRTLHALRPAKSGSK